MSGKLTVKREGWIEAKRRFEEIARVRLQVGVFGGTHAGGIAMVDLLATHEFGSRDGRIPARAPLATTMREHRADLSTLLADVAKRVVQSGESAASALGHVGEQAAGWVKAKIRSTSLPPPIALSTIKRKGHSHALIRTGEMVDAITWRVVS